MVVYGARKRLKKKIVIKQFSSSYNVFVSEFLIEFLITSEPLQLKVFFLKLFPRITTELERLMMLMMVKIKIYHTIEENIFRHFQEKYPPYL